MVKLFTMVKDEIDIVRDWIIYHGTIFGYHNLYIIDNFSTDGTYEALEELRHTGIKIYRMEDYRKKGIYMKELIDKYTNISDPIAFPLDIDEFIAYYDNNQISVDKELINNYIHNLEKASIYKVNYIIPIITKKYGYSRAVGEADYGKFCNLEDLGKSFIDIRYYNGEIDHGNHIQQKDYFLSKIVLIHYHERNYNQMIKKIKNNVSGFQYPFDDINALKKKIKDNQFCEGHHHVINQIAILENKYKLNIEENIDTSSLINLNPIKDIINKGFIY